ncbi:hypothetical protein QJS10_CPA08g00563 [Acorus calamus]|uniref:MBD domain-containing protein n=1 Tax=Acorus calamus TaxID=4465 RepID=A0AAV9E9M9_ACOCL|nr:hypothetical protein QJS10_CPA08g00563 [Acorus calamus]
MATQDKPEWLPDEWMVEVRRRSSGREYKIYVDPVTGYKFYSKPQVCRHLNIGDLEISSDKQNKTIGGICSSDIVTSQFEHSPDGLPPGWIKQTKVRPHSPQKKDQYYIDPVNGYIFRSRKAVFDYLDTGKIVGKVYKSKRENDVNSVDNKLSHSDAVERQNVHGSTARRCLFPDRGSNSSGKSMKDNCEPPKEESVSYGQSTKMELTDAKLPEIVNEDSSQIENISSMVVVREASSLSPVKQTNKPCNENRTNSTSPSDEPAVRVLIIDLTEERPLPESCQVEDQKPVEVAKDELSQSKIKQLEDPVGEKSFHSSLKATNENLSPADGVKRQRKRKDKLLISGPRRASKRLAGIEAELAPDFTISNRALPKGGGARRMSQPKFTPSSEPGPSSLTLSFEKVMDDQSSLENQLVMGDTLGSPFTFPFGDSWLDPCIEFAFKTLTGAAPVFEDVSVIEDFFNQHLDLAQVTGSRNSHVHNGSQKANMYQVEVQMQGQQSISTVIHSGGKSNGEY